MNENDIKALRLKREYLQDWIERYKSSQQIAPHVQWELEMTDWQIRAAENRPTESDEIPFPSSFVQWQQDYQYTRKTLPMLPQYDIGAFANSTGITTAGTASMHSFVARVGTLPTHQAQAYAKSYLDEYATLKATQERPQAVRKLIEENLKNPQTLDRFYRALAACNAAQSGLGERTAAAMEMRTLLDGVKGDLWNLARRQPKENMTWSTMTERLTRGIHGGIEFNTLAQQELVRASLITRLSNVGKDREGQALTEISFLWTQVLEHVYTVLSLIK